MSAFSDLGLSTLSITSGKNIRESGINAEFSYFHSEPFTQSAAPMAPYLGLTSWLCGGTVSLRASSHLEVVFWELETVEQVLLPAHRKLSPTVPGWVKKWPTTTTAALPF